jgi:hypothetical protein
MGPARIRVSSSTRTPLSGRSPSRSARGLRGAASPSFRRWRSGCEATAWPCGTGLSHSRSRMHARTHTCCTTHVRTYARMGAHGPRGAPADERPTPRRSARRTPRSPSRLRRSRTRRHAISLALPPRPAAPTHRLYTARCVRSGGGVGGPDALSVGGGTPSSLSTPSRWWRKLACTRTWARMDSR